MEKSVLEIFKSEAILLFSTRSRTKRFLTSALEAVMRLQLEKSQAEWTLQCLMKLLTKLQTLWPSNSKLKMNPST